MPVALIEKIAFSGVAAAAAAFAGFLGDFSNEPSPAYGAAATRLEAETVAAYVGRVFDRADLNNNGFLDMEEYSILAIVSAELAQLNGFVSFDVGLGVETVALPGGVTTPPPAAHLKDNLLEQANREFAYAAGEDGRLSAADFADAVLEQFLASDADRDGVLAGGELKSFAAAQARLPQTVS